MRYVFIINPAAGKGKGPELLTPAIKEYFGDADNYKILLSECGEDAMAKAKSEAETGDEVTIFACGGDGTFCDVLNGACGYDNVSLCCVPCGSGNDFLKVFGSANDFMDIKSLVEGIATPMDVIKVDDIYCMNICSLGMDATVADDMSIFKGLPLVSGPLAYKLAVVKAFLKKIGLKVKVTVDGVCLGIKDVLFAVCANGRVYGGGYKCAPDADPCDGKLNWILVDTISKLKVPNFLKKYENGEYFDLPYCHTGTCEVMELEAERVAPINIDGEIIHKKKIRFELVRNAVKFVLPRHIYDEFVKKSALGTTN